MSLEMLMSEEEKAMFRQALSEKEHNEYFEYGVGGSSVEAAKYVPNVVGVDSDTRWCDKVMEACSTVEAHHIDIGPVGYAGYPETRNEDLTVKYPESIFLYADKPDVILIDGRFRVACAAQVLMFCQWKNITPIVLLHDAYRSWYVSISRLFRLHSMTPARGKDDGGLFRFDVNLDISDTVARDIFEKFKHDPR